MRRWRDCDSGDVGVRSTRLGGEKLPRLDAVDEVDSDNLSKWAWPPTRLLCKGEADRARFCTITMVQYLYYC